ncbi:MAG: amidase [bacterium]
MNELCLLSATELARRIRTRALSPLEVMDAHLDRALEVNGRLNAIVNPLFDQARDAARRATETLARRRAGELPPLFGVPFTVKETFAVRGMPWTAGIHARRERVADGNATVVERMLTAGAIPIGTTNVPEAAMWMESVNPIHGRTSNPHDTRRTPGGSSGGEGAIIGGGASPLGLGSDIGGSIRMPAHFCGVAGHKPSSGRVPGTGHFPAAHGQVRRYAVCGPLARSVEDLELAMEILSGGDGADDAADAPPFRRLDADGPRPRRVFWYEHGQFPSTPSMAGAVGRAAQALAEHGLVAEPWRPSLLDRGVDIWFGAVRAASSEPFGHVLGEGEPIGLWRELARLPFGRSNHTWPALATVLGEVVTRGRVPAKVRSAGELRHALRAEIEARLGDDGVLICPAFPRVAPRHRAALLRPLEWISTGVFNVLELPVTCVPAGRDEHDLPTGIQIVGPFLRDDLTLAAARFVQDSLGGWRPGRGLHAV